MVVDHFCVILNIKLIVKMEDPNNDLYDNNPHF
nr:MAG TPA: hypothetical protein [Caudoviricetes sp.]